jgi:branched-chain amino acid transport system permease protein
MIGGLGTLIGPVLGAVAIQYLVTEIGGQQLLDANFVLGGILLIFVLALPAGVVPTLERGIAALWRRSRRGGRPAPAEAAAAPSPLPGKVLS